MNRFWKWLFFIVCRKIDCSQRSWCSARYIQKFSSNHYEVTITFLDKSKENHYSREELVEIMNLVRTEEKYQNWKVPEGVT